MKRKLQILKAHWLVYWHCLYNLIKNQYNHQIITASLCNSYQSKTVLIKCNCGKIYFGEETQLFEDKHATYERKS